MPLKFVSTAKPKSHVNFLLLYTDRKGLPISWRTEPIQIVWCAKMEAFFQQLMLFARVISENGVISKYMKKTKQMQICNKQIVFMI